MKKGFIGLFLGACCIILGWVQILKGNNSSYLTWLLFIFGLAAAIAGATVSFRAVNSEGKSRSAQSDALSGKNKSKPNKTVVVLTSIGTIVCVLIAIVCTIWQVVCVIQSLIEFRNPLLGFSIPLMVGSFGGMFASWAFYALTNKVVERIETTNGEEEHILNEDHNR